MVTRGPFEVHIRNAEVVEFWEEDAISPFLEITLEDAIRLNLDLGSAIRSVFDDAR